MSSSGYRLLGFAVWNGGRWYMRGTRWYLRQKYMRRLPSARKATAVGIGATLATGGVVILGRRAQVND